MVLFKESICSRMEERRATDAGGHLSRYVLGLFVAGAVFLYLRTFLLPATPFVAIGDQVLFFTRAVRIVDGQVLYRDFFELVTPGTDLLYALGFRIFGVHAWLMQAWAIALGLALSCVITLIAARIVRGPLVLLPGLLFLVFDFNSALDITHHWYSTLAAMAAAGVLMGGPSLQRISAAGSLCAIATLFTQTQGALALLALVMYLLWLKRSQAHPRFFRLCTVAPPAILIGTWIISQQARAFSLVRNLLWVLAVGFAVLLPFHRQTQWHATLDLPIGRSAFVDPLEFHEFAWLAQRTRPSEPFFNQPALSLYLSLDNPTASEFVN